MTRIMIVEDDPVQQQQLVEVLRPLNAELTLVSDGSGALETARKVKPDLVLLDIIMPGQDGFATCRALTGDPETRHIPVVIVSSKNQEADRVWAQLQGAKALIGKPYGAEELLAEVKTWLPKAS